MCLVVIISKNRKTPKPKQKPKNPGPHVWVFPSLICGADLHRRYRANSSHPLIVLCQAHNMYATFLMNDFPN